MDIPVTKPRGSSIKLKQAPEVKTPETVYGAPKKEPVNQSVPPVPVKETLAKEAAKKKAKEIVGSIVSNPSKSPLEELAKLVAPVLNQYLVKPAVQSGINVLATREKLIEDIQNKYRIEAQKNPTVVNNAISFGTQFLGDKKPVSELLNSPLGEAVNKDWFEGGLQASDVTTASGAAKFGADLFTLAMFYTPAGSVARTGAVEVTEQLFKTGLADDALRLTAKGLNELGKKGELWFGDKIVRAGKDGVADIVQATTKDWASGIAKGTVDAVNNPYVRGLAQKNAINGTWDFASGVTLNVLEKKSRGEEIDPQEALTMGVLNAAAPHAFSGLIRTASAGAGIAKKGLTRLGELGDELVEQSRTTINVDTPFGITDRLKPENKYRATTGFSGVRLGKDWKKDTVEAVKRVTGNMLRTIGYAPSSSYARLVNAVNHAEAYIGNRKEWSQELLDAHTDFVYAFSIRRDYGSWTDSLVKTYGNSLKLASGGNEKIADDALEIISLRNIKKRVQKGMQEVNPATNKAFTEQEIDDTISAIRNKYSAEDTVKLDNTIKADDDTYNAIQDRTVQSGAMSAEQLEELTQEWGDSYRKQYSEMYGGTMARPGKDSPIMSAEGMAGLRVDPLISRLAFISERVSLIIDTELKKAADNFFMQAHKEFPNAFPLVTLRTPEMKQARIDIATKIKATKELIADVRAEMNQASKTYEGQEKRILEIQDKIEGIENEIASIEKSIADEVSSEFGALPDEAIVRAQKIIEEGQSKISRVKDEFSTELKAVEAVEKETSNSFTGALKSVQNSIDITLDDVLPKKTRGAKSKVETAESRLLLEIQALRGQDGELEKAYIDAVQRTELRETSGYPLVQESKYQAFARIIRRNPRLLDLDIDGLLTSEYVKNRPDIARQIAEDIFIDKTGKMSDDEVYQMFKERFRIEKEASPVQAKTDRETIRRYEAQEKKVQKALDRLEQKKTSDGASTTLLQEARKYKSAEEFVKAQGIPMFRGGQELSKTQMTKSGISVSKGRNVADDFVKQKGGEVSELVISPNAKIVDYSDVPNVRFKNLNDYSPELDTGNRQIWRELEVEYQKAVDWAKANGYDAVKLPLEGETRVINHEVLKTKSQLTDIWKKANARGEVPAKANTETVRQLLNLNKRLIDVQVGKKSAQNSAQQIASDVKKIIASDKKVGKELGKVDEHLKKQKDAESRYAKLEEVEGRIIDDLTAYRDELRALDKQVTLKQATKMVTPVRENFKTDKEYRQALRVYNDIKADKEGGMSTYSYYQNGEKVVRAVPTEMLRMFNADRPLTEGFTGNFVRAMATMNNLFKNSTTRYNPVFAILRNPRDWAGAYINHGLGYRDFVDGWMLLYKNTYTKQEYADFFDATGLEFDDVLKELNTVLGGIQANVLDKDLAVMNRKLQSFISKRYSQLGDAFAKEMGEKRSILSLPGDFFGTYFRAMDKINMFVEQTPKAALFAKLLEDGLDMKEAIIKARQASVDFDVIGSWMVTPNRLINFINAAIQGTDITIRAMKNDPTGWFRRAMKLNYISQLVRYNNNRFETEVNNNISSNDKINFWNIIYGTETVRDKDGKLVDVPLYIKIPKPDAFKTISTPYEYMMDIATNMNKRKMDKFLWDYVGSTIPLSFSSVPINLTLAGYAAKKGNAVNPFTGYSVIDPRFQDVARTEQYTNKTNPSYKAISNIAKVLGAGDDNALASPMYMEYLLKNSLGTGVTSLIEVMGSSYSATKALINGDVDAGDFTNTSVYKSVVGTGRPMTDPEVTEAVKEANQITRTRNAKVKRAIEEALETKDKNKVLDALRAMPDWETSNNYEKKKMLDVAKSEYRKVMIGSVKNKNTSTLSGTELYYYAVANWGLDDVIANYVAGNKGFMEGFKEKLMSAKVTESAKETLEEMMLADIEHLRKELPKM